jgi:hypothetical protein
MDGRRGAAAGDDARAKTGRGGYFGGRQLKMPKTTPCTVAMSLQGNVFPMLVDVFPKST